MKRYDISSSDALFLFLDAPRTIEEHLLVKSANTSTKDIVEEKRYYCYALSIRRKIKYYSKPNIVLRNGILCLFIL